MTQRDIQGYLIQQVLDGYSANIAALDELSRRITAVEFEFGFLPHGVATLKGCVEETRSYFSGEDDGMNDIVPELRRDMDEVARGDFGQLVDHHRSAAA